MRHPFNVSWVVIFIILPVAPFLLAGLLRLIIECSFSWDTFSASELAICMSLLCILMNQSLLRSEIHLEDKDRKAEATNTAIIFLAWLFFFMAFFGALTSFDIIVNSFHYDKFQNVRHLFQIIIYILSAGMLAHTLSVQRSFKL